MLQQSIDDVDIMDIPLPEPKIIEIEDSDFIGDEDMVQIEPIPPMDGGDEDYFYPEPSYPPYKCDPYYEYCGGDQQYYGYDQYNYNKGAVHLMVWTSLWQCVAPFAVFSALEKFAYEEQYGQPKDENSPDNEDHYTKEVEAWDMISNINTVVWGPMFALGVLSLSDLIPAAASLYIEHMISNLLIPAYLYSSYLIYEVAIFEGDW